MSKTSSSLSTLPKRLWARVDKSGGPDACWPFQGAGLNNGYGKIRGEGKRTYLPHRLVLAWATGKDGVGLDACHQNTCTTRRCCNPKHLSWKTHKENMQDVINKHGMICTPRRNKGDVPLPLFEEVPF